VHYQCEIVIAPTDDIQAAIAKVLAPFNENNEDAQYSFWDWFVIGGRWAGNKQMAQYDQEKIAQFDQWCQDEKITVSGFRAGKSELNPASQIEKVDAKWNEMFPSDVMVACPVFRHSNDPYKSESTIDGDICTFPNVPATLKCSRVIFADPDNEATFMITDSIYNGVDWLDTKWDGSFGSAVEMFKEKFSSYAETYQEKITPKDDWLVVTVDYHS
jgi:hypothetical protein